MSSPVKYVGENIENFKAGVIEDTAAPFFETGQVLAFRKVFSFLNDKDRDILYLVFVSRKKQLDIKRIIHRSQPSLCYDIKKIRGRLHFIFYLFSNFDIFVDFVENRAEHFTPQEISVMTAVFYASNFTMAARITDCSQGKIRATFKNAVDKLHAERIWDIYELFSTILMHQNAIRRAHKFDVNGFRQEERKRKN